MVTNTDKFSVLRVTENDWGKTDSNVVREFSLTIVLNGQELVSLPCSPKDPQYLAAGFIQSQGLIKSREDIKRIEIDSPGMVRIETERRLAVPPASGGGKGTDYPDTKRGEPSQTKLPAALVFSLMEDFEQCSGLFRDTGGVHGAALCNEKGILVFNEDIGRHNAIDKVFGQCLLQNIATEDCFVITSGRVSSEILLKVARRNIPVLISKNAPTDLGVKLADELWVTLIGFVRGTNMSVYANDWRIVN